MFLKTIFFYKIQSVRKFPYRWLIGFFVADWDKASIADSNYQRMERRVKLCRLTEIVGQITVIILDSGHAILSFLWLFNSVLFVSRLSFFSSMPILYYMTSWFAGKYHMPFNKWKDICFLKHYVIGVLKFLMNVASWLSCYKHYRVIKFLSVQEKTNFIRLSRTLIWDSPL